MHVQDLMTCTVHCCSSTDTADRAANLMWEHDVGMVPVVDPEHGLVGVVTDRDLLMAAHLRGQRLAEIPVRTVMAGEAHGCAPTDTLGEAERVMSEHQVRRLPVLQDGALVGVLSIGDLARAAGTGRSKHQSVGPVQALSTISRPRHMA
jgi:CBS domain-containing protein